MDCLSEKDFVFTKNKSGGLESGGYPVNTLMISAMETSTTMNGGAKKAISNIFKDLAVPAPFLYFNKKYNKNNMSDKEIKMDSILDSNVHDELLKNVSLQENKNDTKMNKTQRKVKRHSSKTLKRKI